jgi:hypothetical protein
MKKIVTLFISLFILTFSICILSSCKKSSNNYYIRCKINGTQITDSPGGAASFSNSPTLGDYFLYIDPGISVAVHDPGGAIKTNVPYTYVAAANTPGSIGETGLTIKNYNGQTYSSSGAITPVVTILITSISSTSVQGTFSGMVGLGTTGSSDVNITDGQFNAINF